MLDEQRAIDVNDPRYEKVLKNLQLAKNDYLETLLKNDAKFQLHDCESFRHKLLMARMQDPNYAQITIPHLTAEIIDEDRSHYYLDWLEDVDRQRMYKAYLERKAAIEAK